MPPSTPSSPDRPDDPRQKGFRTRAGVAEVQAWIDATLGAIGSETIPLLEAAGRVLAAKIVAGVDVPGFDRAAMDGYAIRGEESFGAEPYSPIPLRVVGRSRPGKACGTPLRPGEAIEIATGAPIPVGADAVARVEGTRRIGDQVLLNEPTPPGRHLGRRGEDIAAGSTVLLDRRNLRPQDLGLLSLLGQDQVEVFRRPRVAILITGDELLTPGAKPEGFAFPDANGPMLAALVARDGGVPEVIGPLADDLSLLRETLLTLAARSDLILVSGGSSTGPEDHAPGLVDSLGRLVFHGIAIRPASPAGLGLLAEARTPVALLPGNPVSCLCAYDFFAGRMLRRLGGRAAAWPYRSIQGTLRSKLVSAVGRVDYARVGISDDGIEPIAVSGASILSSATRADGFVVVPEDLEGHPEGAGVTVWLYD